jgi:hypothetical protein
MKKERLQLKDILRDDFIHNSNCLEFQYVNSNEWIENLFDSISRDFPIGFYDFEMYYYDVSYETESNINLLLSRI